MSRFDRNIYMYEQRYTGRGVREREKERDALIVYKTLCEQVFFFYLFILFFFFVHGTSNSFLIYHRVRDANNDVCIRERIVRRSPSSGVVFSACNAYNRIFIIIIIIIRLRRYHDVTRLYVYTRASNTCIQIIRYYAGLRNIGRKIVCRRPNK